MHNILIVEDELIAAEYLKSILENEGWNVINIVDNHDDALCSVNKYKPDLVLMDIMINGSKSGCETAIEIRAISNCYIVFISAYADKEMITYALESKADGYLIKPYNEKEIIVNLTLLFGKTKQLNSDNKKCEIKGGFYFHQEEKILYKNDNIIQLGAKALKIINLLCQNKNSYISYQSLYMNIWDDQINLKKLQMLIYRIREITGEDFIENLKGIGYKIIIDE